MDQTAQKGILDQTLGELLSTNPQAQQKVVSAMQVTPEKMQELLSLSKDHPMMQMKIGDLFKNGVAQQAVSQNPVQSEVSSLQPQTLEKLQSQSLLDKIRKWISG